MRPLLPLLAVLLAVPTAQGALTLTLTPPDQPLAPDTEVGVLAVVATLDCSDLLAQDPTKPVQVSLGKVEADRPGVIVSGPSTIEVPRDACTQPGTLKASGLANLPLAFTRDAPGETPIKLTLKGTLPGPAGQPPLEATGTADVEAAYLGHLSLAVESTILATDGGEAVARITVRNLGNALTQVDVAVTEAPSHVEATPPAPIRIRSAAQGATEAEATQVVEILLLGSGSWRQDTLQLTLTPSSTEDPALKGTPTTVNLLVRNGDLVLGIPAPGPLLAFVLLAGAALVARRRA